MKMLHLEINLLLKKKKSVAQFSKDNIKTLLASPETLVQLMEKKKKKKEVCTIIS